MSYAPAPQPPVATEVPLSAPLYGATFGQAYIRFWKKYATFSGRASRSEFWWAFLANTLSLFVLYILLFVLGFAGATYDPTTGTSAPGPLFALGWVLFSGYILAFFVPYLAITWRRLHDTNRPGPFFFLGYIPFVGGIILLVLLALDTDPAGARFDR